jgi:cell division protein FtsB
MRVRIPEHSDCPTCSLLIVLGQPHDCIAALRSRCVQLESERDRWRGDWRIANDHIVTQQDTILELRATYEEARKALEDVRDNCDYCEPIARRGLGESTKK